MPRKLRTYTTTSGFYDLAVAAPAMKAALGIWGSKNNLFQQGFAKETDDDAIVKATMEQPGTVLRGPVGTREAFKEKAGLPKLADLQSAIGRQTKPATVAKKVPKLKAAKKANPTKARAAAKLYDLAQKRRERAEQRAEKLREKEENRRAHAIEKAATALDNARFLHDKRKSEIAKEQDLLERKVREEEERWRSQKEALEAALSRTRKGQPSN